MLIRVGILSIGVGIVCGAPLSSRASSVETASLPAEVLAFPADSLAVASFDVKRLLASPLNRDGDGKGTATLRGILEELRERFGLDAERDVDRLFLAIGAAEGLKTDGLVLLYGRFNRSRIGQVLQSYKRKPRSIEISGAKAYVIEDRRRNTTVSTAVCVLNSETVIVGAPSAVERLQKARLAGRRPLLTNLTLSRLIEQAQSEDDFWLAADAALLKSIRVGGGKQGPLPVPALPQLQDIMLTGVAADALTMRLIGKTTGEATARNTADVVKGLLLLASMSAKLPEWKTIASLVNVAVKGQNVHLDARLPYALLAKLPSPGLGATRKKNQPGTPGDD